MTTLYWQAEDGRVYIESATLTDEQKAILGKLDGLRGGPPDNRGEWVPVRPEHAAELKARANEQA